MQGISFPWTSETSDMSFPYFSCSADYPPSLWESGHHVPAHCEFQSWHGVPALLPRGLRKNKLTSVKLPSSLGKNEERTIVNMMMSDSSFYISATAVPAVKERQQGNLGEKTAFPFTLTFLSTLEKHKQTQTFSGVLAVLLSLWRMQFFQGFHLCCRIWEAEVFQLRNSAVFLLGEKKNKK